ncbi:hypothetical protein IT411_04100 [Candidatus Peregrinibacteria bacterium]|nr:hypothetical protein [Candidatus Peregrinibacteria bacterium]
MKQAVDFSLVIKPQQEGISWEKFIEESPPFSIALDGYVQGLSRKDIIAPRASFDHHHTNRLYTRATMAQVWMEIRQGILETFRSGEAARIIAHANDCDEDEAGAILILREPHLVLTDTRRRLEQFVDVLDKIDTTCATYPMSLTDPVIQSVFWATDPYREFRLSGHLDKKDPSQYVDVIEQVGKRIKRYVDGTHRRQKADTGYSKIHQAKNWVMISESGKQGRIGAIADGHKAIVSARQRESGTWSYVFTRISDNIHYFDLPQFAHAFNQLDEYKGWGGGDTVIGSSRENGSSLNPDQISSVVNQLIQKNLRAIDIKRAS